MHHLKLPCNFLVTLIVFVYDKLGCVAAAVSSARRRGQRQPSSSDSRVAQHMGSGRVSATTDLTLTRSQPLTFPNRAATMEKKA